MYNMYGVLYAVAFALMNFDLVVTQNDFFPGLRKPPLQQNQNWQAAQNAEILSKYNFLEENARRRLQQLRLQQQQHQQQQKPQLNPSDDSGPEFTYRLPPIDNFQQTNDEKPFAYGPSRSEYYELTDNDDNPSLDSHISSIYNKMMNGINDSPVRLSSDGIPSYKLKAPMDINPKDIPYYQSSYDLSKSKDVLYREDLNKFQKKMREEDAYSNAYQHDVERKHMEMDTALGMYVIALIAGVSAAVTVGLLAIGIGWYTLQKKAKAAADVEYPAYGVTGPNKDISPSSGDRRLAQSAQMYHYQHQKQQIIAMENQNGERNGSASDIETDDENEEGDYTVYECPGLAPTGEMEVKNPLFLDDPTPVVKATVPKAKNQKQQSQSTEKPKNNEPATKK